MIKRKEKGSDQKGKKREVITRKEEEKGEKTAKKQPTEALCRRPRRHFEHKSAQETYKRTKGTHLSLDSEHWAFFSLQLDLRCEN